MFLSTTDLAADVEVVLDIESGGLRGADRPWEIAAIRRVRGEMPTAYVWHVLDFDASKADPKALEMGGFYDRHPEHLIVDPQDPFRKPNVDEFPVPVVPDGVFPGVRYRMGAEFAIAREVERLVRNTVVYGCNPTYDVTHTGPALGRAQVAWTAHYRPLCATTIAATTAQLLGLTYTDKDGVEQPIGRPPWTNRDVGAALGVARDGYGEVHTGLADCAYALALLDAARDHVIDQQHRRAQP